MSASNKKKLRKEQNAISLTEKQKNEQAAAKKLKVYSLTFIAIMLVVVITALTIVAVRAIDRSGVLQKKTIAATIGDHELNSVEMNYYYGDAVNAQYSEWNQMYGDDMSMYLSILGVEVSRPLNKQKTASGDKTWAEDFLEKALESAKISYTLYDMAKAEGLTLTEEQTSDYEASIAQSKLYAIGNGIDDFDEFLKYTYGFGSDEESYRKYLEVQAIANAYIDAHADALIYDEAAIEAYDAENYDKLSSYSFASYFVNYNSYRRGGVENENGKIEYSEEELLAARAEAKEVAEELAKVTSVIEFDKEIAALDVNKDVENAASSKAVDILYKDLQTELKDWVSDSSRKEGDVTVIPVNTAIADDDDNPDNDILGYNVVFFRGRNENLRPLANVRHLLVAFEGGTYDEASETVVYTDEEKAVAKEKIDGLFAEWQNGEATEDSLIALIEEHSDDSSAAEGGLFEDVSPESPYVESFVDWCVDPDRKPGDAEIIESEYGYHIMYYVSDDEMTYREYMITNELRNADMETWYSAIGVDTPFALVNDSKLNLDRTLLG